MDNVLGLDPSKLQRRKVDMSIPSETKPLQDRIYEEAEKQCKAMLGYSYTGLVLDSEYSDKSLELSFQGRVSTIVKATLRKAQIEAELAKKK